MIFWPFKDFYLDLGWGGEGVGLLTTRLGYENPRIFFVGRQRIEQISVDVNLFLTSKIVLTSQKFKRKTDVFFQKS